jgi:hypothetical protein
MLGYHKSVVENMDQAKVRPREKKNQSNIFVLNAFNSLAM